MNSASKQPDTFTVKYHDMADVIDFIVLKQNYDQAMYYDWKPGIILFSLHLFRQIKLFKWDWVRKGRVFWDINNYLMITNLCIKI